MKRKRTGPLSSTLVLSALLFSLGGCGQSGDAQASPRQARR